MLALSLVPALVRGLMRRRLLSRLAAGRANAVDAWSELRRDAADLGTPLPRTATPREVAEMLPTGGAALARLVEAVEWASFAAPWRRAGRASGGSAPDGVTAPVTDAPPQARGLARDLPAVRDALATPVSRRRRLLARLYPPSLWRRIAHPFTRD
jgi:hypothetical protein